ncbi:MAG: crossover junction endodeoxyribonuclease RuvC [Candidatus Melainabacteria bacterium]
MRVLGIDPGLERVGFGLVAFGPGRQVTECRWGVITTCKDKPDGERLQEIHRDLTEIIAALKPDRVSIERLFFFRNVSTMVPVCQARGVILLALQPFGLPVFEYTPMQVKQAITGYGKSTKREIQELLLHQLPIDQIPRPDDAADALAMALCHHQHDGRYERPVSAAKAAMLATNPHFA